jgi:peptide chain release factor 1
VTVAVVKEVPASEVELRPQDLDITTCRGSGPGGQHRNKTESAVQVKHKPSGLYVRCESERCQQQNKRTALALLRSRLAALQNGKATSEQAADRKRQIGSGERSDKVRTVQMQNGKVTDHRTGKKCNVERYLKGEIECLA